MNICRPQSVTKYKQLLVLRVCPCPTCSTFAHSILCSFLDISELSSLALNDNVFHPGYDQLWFYEGLAYIGFDFDGTAFVTCAILLYAIVLTFVFGTLSCYACQCSGCEGELDDFIWYILGDIILFGSFLVPATRLTFEIYDCLDGRLAKDQGIECWIGFHSLLCFLSTITLVCLALVSTCKSVQMHNHTHDPHNPNRMIPSVFAYHTKYQVYRVLLVLISIFILPHNSVVGSLFMLLLSFISLFYFTVGLPYRAHISNYCKAGGSAMVTWLYFSALCISSGTRRDDPLSASNIHMPFLMPLFVVSILAVTRYMLNKRLPLEELEMDQTLTLESVAEMNSDALDLANLLRTDPNRVVTHHHMVNDHDLQDFLLSLHGRVDLVAVSIKRQNTNISRAKLEKQRASYASIESVRSILAVNDELIYLCINGQRLDHGCMEALVQGVCQHPSLRIIDLYDNVISGQAAAFFVQQSLEKSPALRRVNFGSNHINAEERRAIRTALIDRPLKCSF